MRRFCLSLGALLLVSSSALAEDGLARLGPPHPWLKADLGLSFADLRAFKNRKPAPDGAAVGGLLGADVAIRWQYFSLGLRGRFHPLSEFNLWQIAPFAGIHFPQHHYDLSATAHIGYSVAVDRGGPAIAKGAYTGVVVAFDYLVKGPLLVGAGAGSDLLFLGGDPSKSNLGIGFTGSLRLGLLL